MQMIHRFIDRIGVELKDARMYAELYLEYNNTKAQWSRMFHEMAEQELSHANYLKQMGDEFISTLKWVSNEDRDCWSDCVLHYTECAGVTKAMLSI